MINLVIESKKHLLMAQYTISRKNYNSEIPGEDYLSKYMPEEFFEARHLSFPTLVREQLRYRVGVHEYLIFRGKFDAHFKSIRD